ncbi:trimeric intracellular cation channel family protein [Sneathiella sp. CAU 1612]|uniref:Trimeric intracellular cation channel family protein n=1 Tax=Sneathiella sedimenti TaxID=2816034 RepID=A0ABS3F252_9PROT|nr:trimeric intracellular cation channel family protein [Sneathiella sedimenti]MBO0332596.1 trimeric intracellular cation channel family protein [Sneathiella sedimenti]
MFTDFITILDLVGVAVFAATGGLVASRKEMDLIGFGMMATFTGVGGGTVRDVILDRPVFWVEDHRYLLVCLGIALLLYFFASHVQRRYVVLLWSDAIGLAAFAVLGAQLAREADAGPLIAIVLGMITATFGGLARDLVAGETPLLLKQEIYATAALVSAAVYVVFVDSIGVAPLIAAIGAILTGFAVRAGAILFGWSLPRYKQRAGRIYK